MSEVVSNGIWVGGVQLSAIVSGDISAVEEKIVEAKLSGKPQFVYVNYEGGSYRFWIAPDTDVVIQKGY